MQGILALIGLVFCNALFGQHYYIALNGDTVNCEILREGPDFIRIKGTDSKKDKITAKEMKGYISNYGVLMASKRILNHKKKDSLILLPVYASDQKLVYKDYEIAMTTGNGVTFYELTVYGSPQTSGGVPMGRITIEDYIENDSIGVSKINYLTNQDDEQQKVDAINSVYFYLMSNKEIEKKLSVYADYRNFTEKGLKKIIAEFIGKKLN
jgi:hypothetical protein